MRKLLLLTSICFISLFSQAQTAKNALFMEIGGPSITAINYDVRLPKIAKGFGLRAGFGGLMIDNDGALFIPLGANYLLSKDNKNHFEIGAGVTILKGTDTDIFDNESPTFGHLNFGYRYQPANGGFVFRAAVTPIFGKGFFWSYYGGISFGYAF